MTEPKRPIRKLTIHQTKSWENEVAVVVELGKIISSFLKRTLDHSHLADSESAYPGKQFITNSSLGLANHR